MAYGGPGVLGTVDSRSVTGITAGAIWSQATSIPPANNGGDWGGPNYAYYATRSGVTPGDPANGYDVTIPGWSMNVLGFDVGLPVQSEDVASQPKLDYGDVQVWFGTYIDPTIAANYAKVVTISGGIGTPANPTIAAAAFGTQSLLFKGGASTFYTNAGNGGAFTKTGVISDFTPGPSY